MESALESKTPNSPRKHQLSSSAFLAKQRRPFGVSKEAKKATGEIKSIEVQLKDIDLSTSNAGRPEGNEGIILTPVAEQDLARGIERNGPCQEGHSRVHKLECGHIVLCEHATPCGSNCQEDTAVSDNARIYCTLCLRRVLNWDVEHHNNRWQDLLLPTFIMEEKEGADWKTYENVVRASEPAYIDPSGNIIRPVTQLAVALIRSYERQKETFLKSKLKTTCLDILPLPDEAKHLVKTRALADFNRLLCHHHTFQHMDLRNLAALALCAAAHETSPVHIADRLITGALDADPAVFEHFRAAHDHIVFIAAMEKVRDFVFDAPKKYREHPRWAHVIPVTKRIWQTIKSNNVISRTQRKGFEDAVTAACVVIAAGQFRIVVPFEDACAAFEVKSDTEEQRTGNRYAYGKVARYVKARDYRRPLGRRVSANEKVRKRVLRRDRETEGLNKALASLFDDF